jgi:hypothetical protein
MRMRVRKPTRSKKPATGRVFDRVAQIIRETSTRTMVIAVMCFVGAAMLIGAATSDVNQDKAAAHAQAQKPAASSSMAAAAPAAGPSDAVVPPVPMADGQATAKKPAPVTITGCLERDDNSFRLKETAGDNAPKSRSWKSGFLKKGPAPVSVVDASNRLKLPSHVGERVSVTGTLVDREMQGRTLQRVASSCNMKS